MAICECCGQALPERRSKGPLTVTTEPMRASWHGINIYGLSPMQCRILIMLMQLGRCSNGALMMLLMEETSNRALKVHICRLRTALRSVVGDHVKINNIWGWGYELVVSTGA